MTEDFKDKVLQGAAVWRSAVSLCEDLNIGACRLDTAIIKAFGSRYKDLCITKSGFFTAGAYRQHIKIKPSERMPKSLLSRVNNLSACEVKNAMQKIIQMSKRWATQGEVRSAVGFTEDFIAFFILHKFGVDYGEICATNSGFEHRAAYKLSLINEGLSIYNSVEGAAAHAGVSVEYAEIRLRHKKRDFSKYVNKPKVTRSIQNSCISYLGNAIKITTMPTQNEDGQAAVDIISKWSAKIIESKPNYIKIAIPYNWRIGIGIFGRTVVFNANKKMVASWDGNLRTPFRQY